MGLDQYAHRVKENGERTEIAYWRKHNRLQGWMENLWIQKGKPDQQTDDNGNLIEDFNCVDVELTWEDIDQLAKDIDNRHLPETGGFFFGSDSYSYITNSSGDLERVPSGTGHYQDLKADLDFIEIAKLTLDLDEKVVYTSWW